MNRKELIRFIKNNDPFYYFVNFDGHSLEQLDAILKRIDKKIQENIVIHRLKPVIHSSECTIRSKAS